ncbi:uncharacterized protein LOC111369999 [Olea europaea var. sylvestris]|uniref:uncharacterized protein LOC111369999 n=1 Tax=Olea europaea var. sylvestris TaxID=158386 RepID=UPI000C1CD2A7|nr:uncharacterized protein LOC111369999 [Olea europaea var. sylvestris]
MAKMQPHDLVLAYEQSFTEDSQIVIYSDSISQIWEELKKRFAKSSNSKIFMLEQQLAMTKQEKAPRQERRQIMQFLMGLDEAYNGLRNQILLRDPLPSLDRVFNFILQEEANQELTKKSNTIVESTAMFFGKVRYQKNSSKQGLMNNYKGMRPKDKAPCKICGRTNHSIDNCWEINGYSPNHKFYKATTAPGKDYKTTNIAAANEGTNSSSLNISHDQIQQLIALLQSQKSPQASSTSKPIGNQHSTMTSKIPSTFPISISHSLSYMSTEAHSNSWILDSGATDPIVSSLNMFTHKKSLSNMFVRLPNGTMVAVT